MPWFSWIASNIVLASLVALAAWAVQRGLGRPGAARILWVLALVKLVTPPVVSVPLVELPAELVCSLGVCGCAEHAGPLTAASHALPWALLATWAVGAGATLTAAWRRWAQFRRLTGHAQAAPPKWQALGARVASELSIRRPPEILCVPGRMPPLVTAGWRRPRLLLPMELIGRLSAPQRRALLVHELMHLKRGDHLVRWLELAVAVAFWWLPMVGAIGRRLRDCEEACCDAAVVARLPRARRDYARLLLDVVDFADPLPRLVEPQATAMSAAEGLERRLRGILVASDGPRRSRPVAAMAVVMACALLPCGLHSEFARQPAAATSNERCAAAGARRWIGCEPPVDVAAFKCPEFVHAE